MYELTKKERKAYNAQIQKRNEGLRTSSIIFGMLTIICFFGAVFVPIDLAVYLIGAAGFFAIIRWITSKLAG